MVALRDYQQQCLHAVVDSYKAGVHRQLVCLPTGTGKTVVFAQFPKYLKMKRRMLVIAHREELLTQARDKILQANPHLCVHIEQADNRASDESQVVIASVPTIGRRESARLERLDPDAFSVIVIDEAHHATAETYRRILDHFRVFLPDTRKLVVGFTATPKRGDGLGLSSIFEEIVFSRDLPEMVAAGYLSPLVGYRVETDTDLSGVRTRMGDFVPSQLSDTINLPSRNALVVKAYHELLQDRPTLCFCVDVLHAQNLADSFEKAGVPCAPVIGQMDREERGRVLANFRQGKLRVLANCMVLTEGYDEPSVAGIILARPTKSALLYTQMIGRGTRLHPNKSDATVVDIVDVTRDHKLVTLPTLFGLPGSFDLKGHTTTHVLDAMAWARHHRPWVPVDGVSSLDDLRFRCKRVDLLDLEIPSEIADCASYAWVHAGTSGYRLMLPQGESLLVASNILGAWEATRMVGKTSETIGQSKTLHGAIAAAESFVKHKRPTATPLLSRDTRWRRSPATDKQLEVLRRIHIQVPDKLTRGQASHIIGMLTAQRESV